MQDLFVDRKMLAFQNQLIVKLQENLKTYDTLVKKREKEALRKKRIAYVEISLDNIIHKDRSRGSQENSQESSDDSDNSGDDGKERRNDENDGKYKISTFTLFY